MKKFEVTHSNYKGKALLTYNEGYLVCIDVVEATMQPKQIYDFVRAVPVKASNLPVYAEQSGATVINVNWTYTLEDFKHDYPYARNMHLLPDIWRKISATDLFTISIATPKYRKYCERNKEWYNPKIAFAWLQKKEYLNDWDKMDKK